MNTSTNESLMKNMLLFKLLSGGNVPPTHEQIMVHNHIVDKRIMTAQLLGIAVGLGDLILMYLNLWTDGPAPGLQMINPLLIVYAGAGLIGLFLIKRRVDVLKQLRKELTPSEDRVNLFKPNISAYMDAVKNVGRSYLTNYEVERLQREN